MQIDYVITYVDGSDPEWQREYEKVSGKKINAEKSERFRSWDNLRYNLRAVEKNLPFIRKVHLVVSGPSQVPSWVNTDTVHVVYHKDIIPEKFLPVFCSTAIEMFLGFIPGLADNFIYANDDTFVAKTCKISDFFVDGKPVLNYSISGSKYNTGSQYEVQLANSFGLAQKVSGKVMVAFIVNTDGSVEDVRLVQRANIDLDNEALRVVRMMPKWEPGKSNGKPCRTLVHLPIIFKL